MKTRAFLAVLLASSALMAFPQSAGASCWVDWAAWRQQDGQPRKECGRIAIGPCGRPAVYGNILNLNEELTNYLSANVGKCVCLTGYEYWALGAAGISVLQAGTVHKCGKSDF